MKTKNLLFLLLVLPLWPSFANPKESIAIIKATPSTDAKSFMESLADEMNPHRGQDLAKAFRNFATGWFGSGFLLETEDGNKLLVTNRHVVAESDTLSITFNTDEATPIVLEGQFPLFQDKILDLALIDVPDEKVEGITPLKLRSSEEIHDGDDVFAAGYPALLGTPGWQLSKGVVTNGKAVVEQIYPGEVTSLIQHGAAIDAGNSGGPLLVKSEEGWIVLGVNTWSILNRNDTYFALPAERVKEMITRMGELDREQLTGEYRSTLEDLEKFLARETWESNGEVRMLSQQFVLENAWTGLISLFDSPDEEKRQVSKAFDLRAPFELLRESTSWWLWKTFASQKRDAALQLVSAGELPETVEEGSIVISDFQLGERTLEVEHQFLQGAWYLRSFQFPIPVTRHKMGSKKLTEAPKKQRNKGRSDKVRGELDLLLIPGMGNTTIIEDSFLAGGGGGLTFYIPQSDYHSFIWDIFLLRQDIDVEDDYYNEVNRRKAKGFSMNFGGQLHYPFENESFLLLPFIEGAVGMTGLILVEDDDLLAFIQARLGGGVSFSDLKNGWGLSASLFRQFDLMNLSSIHDEAIQHYTFRLGAHMFL